jgi:hypothetical protein
MHYACALPVHVGAVIQTRFVTIDGDLEAAGRGEVDLE